MKIHTIIICCCLVMLAASCKKLDIKPIEFDVTTVKKTYKIGDTVNFIFSGNPDNITYYSGEAGHRYINKDRVFADGKPQLEFTSYKRNGVQENTLFLYASTNFNGNVDSANIYAATWQDITNRAILSTGADNTPSGIVNLSDFVSNDKPLYLAYKYIGYAGSAQRIWNIKSFNITNILTNEPSSEICNIDNAGWLPVSISGDITWTITTGQIYFYGPTSAAGNAIRNEDWIITKPLYLNKVYPDKGFVLKNMSTRIDNYTYTFNSVGTYDVVFVASNVNVKQEDAIVKHLTIDVTP